MSDSIWGYQPTAGYIAGTDLIGYKVEATDGSIGKVDKHSDEVDSSYLVVDTGVWIFGKHVLLPAGTVQSVDQQEQKIYVALTKDEIKHSPEFVQDKHLGDADYHERVGGYYTGLRTI
ncbi:PRC-barrel domain-containing protein [Streptomyces sp. NPDC005281]|uniref:PRC-barrel domain-containing protein n=1 Tax=Streptomyces sp. NPDC005281 TaxID=3155712 RepID=UPI0033A81408